VLREKVRHAVREQRCDALFVLLSACETVVVGRPQQDLVAVRGQ
jgi:hypothetical protein